MSAYMLSEGVVPSIAAQLGFCVAAVRFAGYTIGCDKDEGHDGPHGGVYPSDEQGIDVAVSWAAAVGAA